MTLTSTKPIQKETTRGNGANAPPLGTTRLDEALAVLQAPKDAWVATGIAERIALLAEVRQRMAAIGERWVAAILAAKGTTNDAFSDGVSAPWT